MWNLPNILTMGRIAVLPFMFMCFSLESSYGAAIVWTCFGLYVLAALTDFFDGWAARKFNKVSAFGTFLDPISDKIFVGCLLMMLVGFGRLDGLWMISALLILFREFLVSGLREFLGPHNVTLPVTNLAKWKTTLQMIALGFLVVAPALPVVLIIGQWCLLAAAVLTLITGWGYMKAGWSFMSAKDKTAP